jgi:dCMP deaminase
MEVAKKIPPRLVPDRDSKYMALAWFYAGFSKDPSTQVGAIIVDEYNYPLGCGYNGPPRLVPDDSFSWDRTPDSDGFSKYDIIVHAEINAIDHSFGRELANSTLYCTGLPCKRCMLEIVRKEIGRVVYMEFHPEAGSMFQKNDWKAQSLKIAEMGRIKVEEFKGGIAWMSDWILRLKALGVLG